MKVVKEKQSSNKELSIAKVNESNTNETKEYITYTKKLLEDFKMMQNVIAEASYQEVPLLLKVARNNLSKACAEQIDEIIQELHVNFSEKSINLFIEKSISIITSMDTANFIYGNIIEVNDLKKYLSSKLTKIITFRSEKLMDNLKTTSFEEKTKINVIVDNLNLCIKLLDYSWDILSENTISVSQSNKILERLIQDRVKLGLDNYNVELLRILIEKNMTKIQIGELGNDNIISDSIPSNKIEKNIIINSEDVANTINSTQIDTTEIATVSSKKNSITDKYIELTNNVIKDVIERDSNDFLNVALQKFYSIINSLETVNFLKGDTINKEAVTKNISNLIIDLVDRNFIQISSSWNSMTNKTDEDNKAYYKELQSYKDMFYEAYKMCPSNIDSLKKYVSVIITIYKNKIEFKLTKGQISLIESEIVTKIDFIKTKDPNFNPTYKNDSNNEPEKKKKKKSWWNKIFN
ncbi:MAG: hypothetical protein ACRC7N_12525 [Clostridium sp.]